MKHHKNLNKIKQRALWECISKVVLFIKMTYCWCASWVFPLWIYIHIVGAQITAPHRDLFIVKKQYYSRVKDRVKNMHLHIFNLCICGTYTQYTRFVCRAFASISIRTTLKCLNLGLRVTFCFILMRILESKFTMFRVFKKINTTSVCRSKCTK